MTKSELNEDASVTGSRPWKGWVLKFGVLGVIAVFGGLGGYGLARYAKNLQIEVSLQSLVAYCLGFGLAIMGIVIVVTALNGTMALSAGEAYKLSRKERHAFALQGAILMLAGVMLSLVEGGRLVGLAGGVGFGLVVALMAFQTALNVWVWKASDELIRRVSIEAAAFCFWLLQGCLFLYAAAEQFALVPTVSAWTLTLVLMGVYLISSTVIAIRRGLSQ
ncbi:MAG: hypothetical protein ACK41P_08890 [Asticcacaulis sp.]